jgi:hypothetical protein
MRSKSIAFAIALIFILASSVAGDEPDRVRKSELDTHPFTVGELKITITSFRTGSLLIRPAIRVRVENTSGSAVTFNPQRLSFVLGDNKQISVRGQRRRGDRFDFTQPREIAPGAYVKEIYDLDGRVHLPARLFYEGKELALIAE